MEGETCWGINKIINKLLALGWESVGWPLADCRMENYYERLRMKGKKEKRILFWLDGIG